MQVGIGLEDIVEHLADRGFARSYDAALGIQDDSVFRVVSERPVEVAIVVRPDLIGDQTEGIGRGG